MRQRNDTQTVWRFAETDTEPAHEVAPGETTNHPVLLNGWTAIDETPKPRPSEEPAKATSSRKRPTAADDKTDKDGGEPR